MHGRQATAHHATKSAGFQGIDAHFTQIACHPWGGLFCQLEGVGLGLGSCQER
jgi:hypothetical protein